MKLLRIRPDPAALLARKPLTAHAHVGSKDVFEQAYAGPYKLFVTIRMPNVIPGVANVEVRSTGAPVTGIDITPLPLTGEASKHPPSSDPMKVSAPDPAFFTGAVWMMASGSMQIRFTSPVRRGADHLRSRPGGRDLDPHHEPQPGHHPRDTWPLPRPQHGRSRRCGHPRVPSRARLSATASLRRRGLIAMLASLAFMALLLYGGAKWWNVEAAGYSRGVYRPLKMEATLTGEQLKLDVQSYNPRRTQVSAARSNDDFIPDHGHLMHLYAIRQPGMDAVFHLHPTLAAPGDFRLDLPSMPPGTYTLYGDVVHANGFPETLVTNLAVPDGITGPRPTPSLKKATDDDSSA